MSDTTFVDYVTPVPASWLNDVNDAVYTTFPTKLAEHVSGADFGMSPSLVDNSAAMTAALSALADGGTLELAGSTYNFTSPILVENKRGIRIIGKPGQYGFSGTRLIGKHTGKATVSLVGSVFCSIENISIEGDSSAKPKVGLLLGRSSAASAGNHTFLNVHVQGYFQLAGLYNVASEENVFINPYIVPTTATLAGVYLSQGDSFGVGGLTPSSMECNNFLGGTLGNGDNTAGTTGIYLDCGGSTGHINFYSPFMTKNGGDSFIKVRLGATDGLDTTFPITFMNLIGEHNTNQPTTGLHFTSASSKIIAGFTAKNIRFQDVATNNILCDGGGTVYFVGADISTPYMSSGNKPSTFHRLDASTLALLSESAITIAAMYGSSVLYNAAPTITTSVGNILHDSSGTTYSVSTDLSLSTGKTIKIGGTQVVGSRKTGYVSMTGTVDRSTVLDTSTITLAQLAQRVNALQTDLTNQHGLIGT